MITRALISGAAAFALTSLIDPPLWSLPFWLIVAGTALMTVAAFHLLSKQSEKHENHNS